MLVTLPHRCRYEIKDMHICRSALSCCVISNLPHEVIKTYCEPRETSVSPWQQEEGEEMNAEATESVFEFSMNDNDTPD